MTESAPAVALLFDDSELGGQLREALHERGARIVHEGEVSGLSRELLQQVGADVLVVNLDDGADDALDQLYEIIDGDRPRVVFNDAQASRSLAGWDRARWARHLAVKVLAAGDIDPPRPGDARMVDTPVAPSPVEAATGDLAAVEAPVVVAVAEEFAPIQSNEPVEAPVMAEAEAVTALDPEPFDSLHEDSSADQHEQTTAAESEGLAAELEALLASGELSPDEEPEESGPGLRHFEDDELPPLHDGNFGGPSTMHDQAMYDQAPANSIEPAAVAEIDNVSPVERVDADAAPMFQTDHLQLSSMVDASVATIPAAAAEPLLAGTTASVRAPDSWALLDDDAPLAAPDPAEKPDAANFGIEKLSAADFLAPDVEAVAPDVEPMMSLELVSMEEAIAPQAYVHDHEMVLDDLGSALSRIVLLGAAISGADSVCEFLAALPATTRLTFLHTQHLGDQEDTTLVERFAARCALPVRLAEQGAHAGIGEVLVVPAGHQARLRRDGSIELQGNGADDASDPSIDASLTAAAGAFGRDALAIIFAGRGNDAVAGAQAIHDRGGQVWVESSSGEHFADMVSGIFAERLVSFSGTPPELAAHLIEVFP